MGRTTSVTIGDPLNDFIEKLIQNGRYGSTSEVMRSALRLLEQQEIHIDQLRSAIDEGEQSGESNFSLKDIAKMRKAKLNV